MTKEKIIEISNAIRGLREDKGISQKALAEKMGMDITAYNKIEKGHGNITTSTLLKIADALEVEPVVLLGSLSEDFLQLWSMYQDLSPERQQRIMDQMEDLIVAEKASVKAVPSSGKLA